MSADRQELRAKVEKCPWCGVKALENPTSFDEAAAGMREHIALNHGPVVVLLFDAAFAIYRVGKGKR